MRKSEMVLRVDHEKNRDGVTVHHNKEQWGKSSP